MTSFLPPSRPVAALASLLLVAACASEPPAGSEAPAASPDEQAPELGTRSDELFGLPDLGEGSVFATIPTPPGYPEGIVVVGNRVYVSGPATFGTAGKGASEVRAFHLATGAPAGTIVIAGEDLAQEHALSCITADAQGRLYALSTQLGVVRLTPSGNTFVQDIYAPLPPDLAPCTPQSVGACSPTSLDGPPLPNDLAFDWAGNLYITDSLQATIFRVPAGGGAPQVWFQSPAFEGYQGNIGLNGIRVSPDQKRVYVTVTLPAANPAAGAVYSLPRVASPAAGDLALVHSYAAGEAPDGIAFGLSGKLYVALAVSNAISVLNPSGTEKTRLTGPAGSTIALDGPANIAFDRHGSLLVTNHASLSNNPASFAVLKVFAADLAFPLPQPLLF